jgi:hypothetical protein
VNAVVEKDGREEAIARLLVGAVDLHCHSGPSVMPRDLDHVEALREAGDAGMSAVLIKDHYYSATPVTELLNEHFGDFGVKALSGVPLNNAIGGFNVYAVDHGLKLGACLVWMPTFSAANHIDQHRKDADFKNKFPQTKKKFLEPKPLTALDEHGKLREEVLPILDLIAEHDAVLSAGHLHIDEVWPLFAEARKRGIKRLLVNHPPFVVNATLEDMATLAEMGVYMEHSMCMFVEGSKYRFWDSEDLRNFIEAGTVDLTILGSDLGQSGNPHPVEGFKDVIGKCLDLKYSEEDIKKMVSSNARSLIGLD